MIIAIIIISILILAISLTKFYKWNLLSYYFALATLFYYIFSCLTWAIINNIKKKKGNIETKKIEIKNL